MVKKKKIKKRLVKRTSEGKFVKGSIGNPNGRPKGSKNKYSLAELFNAIKVVESRKGRKPLLQHFVEQAYDDHGVLIALMKKLLPDLRAVEGVFADFRDTMDKEMANDIRNKLMERFK